MTLDAKYLFFLLLLAAVTAGCSDDPVGTETPEPSQVRLTGDEVILGIGGTLKLSASVADESGVAIHDAGIEWSTSKPDVIIVDDEGVVTSVGHGAALVVAKSGAVTGTKQITVKGSGDFKYPSSNVVISGRLTLPLGTGPFPAVVTVPGSEAARKENYQIPAIFQSGIALLSYDKRGVGESTGVCPCPGGIGVSPGNSKEQFQLLADDVLAGVAFLKRHHDVDSTKIGLVGWSQAGWIIPIAADRSDDVAFMVNIVGPTVTIGQEIFYSNLTGDSGNGPLPGGRTFEEIYDLTEAFTGNDGFDPIPILRRVDTPGLWPLGGMDRSIPTPLTIARIESLVDELGKPFTVHLYPNGDHGLVDVTTGQRIPHWTLAGGTLDWVRSIIDHR